MVWAETLLATIATIADATAANVCRNMRFMFLSKGLRTRNTTLLRSTDFCSTLRQFLLEQFLRSVAHRFVSINERVGDRVEGLARMLCPRF